MFSFPNFALLPHTFLPSSTLLAISYPMLPSLLCTYHSQVMKLVHLLHFLPNHPQLLTPPPEVLFNCKHFIRPNINFEPMLSHNLSFTIWRKCSLVSGTNTGSSAYNTCLTTQPPPLPCLNLTPLPSNHSVKENTEGPRGHYTPIVQCFLLQNCATYEDLASLV